MHSSRLFMQSRKLRVWPGEEATFLGPGLNPAFNHRSSEASVRPRLTYTQPSSPISRVPRSLPLAIEVSTPS